MKDRYIEMVQSHGAMQLSMGAATIPGIVMATRKFVLRLTPDKNGQPREPTKKSLMDILQLMEIADKKVWLCVTREPNRIHTGYFSSVVEEIKLTLRRSSDAPRLRCTTGSNARVALAKISTASYAGASQWSNNRRSPDPNTSRRKELQ